MLLTDNDIHIWRADTRQLNAERLQAYRELMSDEEKARNQRYRFEKDRDRDSLTRALVRTVLSQYTTLQPAEWQFSRGEHGKPELLNAPIEIRFNLSHTDRFVVCAITRHQQIGIDIEHIERKNDVRAIADHYFSAQEVRDLFALEYRDQADRFFDYWTLKEAYMKARGEGISLGLGNFSFDLGSGNIGISFSDCLDDCPEQWMFRLFRPTADHRMALAFRLSHPAQRPDIHYFETIPLLSVESSPMPD